MPSCYLPLSSLNVFLFDFLNFHSKYPSIEKSIRKNRIPIIFAGRLVIESLKKIKTMNKENKIRKNPARENCHLYQGISFL